MLAKFGTIGLLLGGVITPGLAAAQALDRLGNRASALGAFVAVADDSSAVVWNPAGLINGPIFNVLLDFGRTTLGSEPLSAPAGRSRTSFLAASALPLGISYYRMRQSEIDEDVSAAGRQDGREDRQVVVRSAVTSHLGVTLLQSITEGVTVGATVKLVRGSVAGSRLRTTSLREVFDRADALEGASRTTADVDVGMLAGAGRLRAGLVARNLAAPTFGNIATDGASIELKRHVRAGAAWGDGWPGRARLIVAVDADLTRVPHPGGARRDLAAGAERWFRGQRFAVRGGVRASTWRAARPIASGGLSIAVRGGIYVDLSAAAGRGDERRWGIAARLLY